MPIMSGKLIMELWDEDKTVDELAGSMIFNVKDMIKEIEKNGK
jgi:hypothetical protein